MTATHAARSQGGSGKSAHGASIAVTFATIPLAPHCFRSHRPESASQTQSESSRFRSGKSGSSLTRKPKRSQSSSPGHLPVHTCRRGSSAWKCAQPSAAQPQCGQRSTSQPSRWRSPMGAPQSGQGLGCLLMLFADTFSLPGGSKICVKSKQRSNN